MLQTSREGGGEETGRLRRQMGHLRDPACVPFQFIVRDFVVAVTTIERVLTYCQGMQRLFMTAAVIGTLSRAASR